MESNKTNLKISKLFELHKSDTNKSEYEILNNKLDDLISNIKGPFDIKGLFNVKKTEDNILSHGLIDTINLEKLKNSDELKQLLAAFFLN